jgi:hypothetical protein
VRDHSAAAGTAGGVRLRAARWGVLRDGVLAVAHEEGETHASRLRTGHRSYALGVNGRAGHVQSGRDCCACHLGPR